MDVLVRARGLVKRYGDLTAVAGIDFEVRRGECFGLLGPNGSGKSSTLRMVCAVSPLSGGELTVFGLDVRDPRQARAIRSRIGVVAQEENLDPDFTVLQNLMVYSRYFNVPRDEARRRAMEYLEFFHLAERARSKINTLSGGMKKRVQIARALIHNPELVVLDEPTTGLDPQSRLAVWDRLNELKERGITLILSTNYMDEAQYMADRLIILDRGRVLAEGSPAQLIRRYVGEQAVEVRFRPHQRERVVSLLTGAGVPFIEGANRLYAYPHDGRLPADELRATAESVTFRSANLEDVFLRLTGRELREE